MDGHYQLLTLFKNRIIQIARHALPFIFLMLFTTAVLTIFPEIALFLPKLMIAK